MAVLGGLIDAIRDGMHVDVGLDVLMVENVVGVVREIVDVVEMVVGVLDIVGVDLQLRCSCDQFCWCRDYVRDEQIRYLLSRSECQRTWDMLGI